MRDLNIRWLGKLPYSEAYDLQLGLHRSVSQEDSKDDYLLLLEHNNVITSGRSSKENNLLVSKGQLHELGICLLYTSPSPRDATLSRMPSSA